MQNIDIRFINKMIDYIKEDIIVSSLVTNLTLIS